MTIKRVRNIDTILNAYERQAEPHRADGWAEKRASECIGRSTVSHPCVWRIWPDQKHTFIIIMQKQLYNPSNLNFLKNGDWKMQNCDLWQWS